MLLHSRIQDNSNIHLADGDYIYNFDGFYVTYENTYNASAVSKYNVSFYGEHIDKTIIRTQNNFILQPSGNFMLNNLTLINTAINVNNGNLTVNDVIFKDSVGVYCDGHHNCLGGVIYADVNSVVDLSNCQFINTSSQYGGAIYITNGDLKIINSSFINSTSTLWVGAILTIEGANVNVSKTKFINF